MGVVNNGGSQCIGRELMKGRNGRRRRRTWWWGARQDCSQQHLVPVRVAGMALGASTRPDQRVVIP